MIVPNTRYPWQPGFDLRPPKRKMPTLLECATYWAGRTDWGPNEYREFGLDEPSCAACGWMVPDTLVSGWPLPPRDLNRIWVFAARYLDRAHLVDHAFDGSDDVSNVIPLCHLCHRDMPMFKVAEQAAALAWVSAKPRRPHWFQALTDEVARLDPERQKEMTGDVSRSWLRKLWLWSLEQRALGEPKE